MCRDCAAVKNVCPMCVEDKEIHVSNKKKKAAEALAQAAEAIGTDTMTVEALLKGEKLEGFTERERRTMLRAVAGKDGAKEVMRGKGGERADEFGEDDHDDGGDIAKEKPVKLLQLRKKMDSKKKKDDGMESVDEMEEDMDEDDFDEEEFDEM